MSGLANHKVILQKYGLDGEDEMFCYQMLSRMKSDCDYYLGYGHRHAKHLWASSEEAQIECMKALWESIPKDRKPEWLTRHDLAQYESALVGLGATVYHAYRRRWIASEEVKEQAAAYRKNNPGLCLDNSGWSGCKFYYKALNGGSTAVVSLRLLPEYFTGDESVKALTEDERWKAYDELLLRGYKAHEYLLDGVQMFGPIVRERYMARAVDNVLSNAQANAMAKALDGGIEVELELEL